MQRLDMIASRLLAAAPRLSIAESQRQLAEAQAEVATGRHADVGLALGSRVGSTISLRMRLDELTGTADLTKQASLRADITQTSLSALTELAHKFQSMLSGARGAENGRPLAASTGMSLLEQMRSTLSTTHDGQYIFGGLRTDTSPLVPYSSGPRQAIIGAFEAQFGFSPSSPSAANLSATELVDFLDGAFSDLFSDAAWTATWSNATGDGPVFRPAAGDEIDLQANVNQRFARSLAMAFSMIEVLADSSINREAFEVVSDRALSRISETQLQIGVEQARIGVGQNRLSIMADTLESRQTTITSAIRALEGVDSYEAAVRVNSLMTQLEASYALTGRISKLSLLNYI
jgi:flagellar hook-associated protein 3 FlgL